MRMRERTKTALFALAAVAFVSAALFTARPVQVAPVSAFASDKPMVVIDAGHGGIDGGAVGVSGVTERDLNLAVAERLELLLTLFGSKTAMTRTTAEDLAGDTEYPTIKARKTADMYRRLELANSYDNALFVSIHMNMFSQSRYSGAQVFYAASDDSEQLAKICQEKLINFADPSNTRAIAPADKRLFLFKNVTYPAVLVECGFLSNRAEEEKLRTSAYQTTLAIAIAVSVAEFQRAGDSV